MRTESERRHHVLLLVGDKVGSWTAYICRNGLTSEPPTFTSAVLGLQAQYPFRAELDIKPRASGMLGQHSTD